jgi:fibronectin-binding autotransporter adhesin
MKIQNKFAYMVWNTKPRTIKFVLLVFSALCTQSGPQAFAQSQLYWVGELNNDWNQANWSADSSGSKGTSVPGPANDVVFASSNARSVSASLGASSSVNSLSFVKSSQVSFGSDTALLIESGRISSDSGVSTISGAGAVSVADNFTKGGSGMLNVESNLLVGGGAVVQSGTLSINGKLLAREVTVTSGATLAGSGIVFAPVQVSGTLSPGNSVGVLTVGSLQLQRGSQTIIEIASQSSNDVIIVNGDAAVGGRLVVSPAAGSALTYGDSYAFLATTGQISGEFDRIVLPQGFRGRFLNSGQVGTLLVAPASYAQVATTPNERSAAKALDTYITADSGDRFAVSVALDELNVSEYSEAFAQVSPAIYAALPMLQIEQAYNQAQLISQRLGQPQSGAKGFQYVGLADPGLRYDRNGKSVADPKNVLPMPGETVAANWNAWVMATGQFSNSKGWQGVPSSTNNAGGFLAGVDYHWSDEFATGIFGGYQYSQADFSGGGYAKGNGVYFGLYSAYTNSSGFHADAIVGGGYTGFQTRRPIAFGSINRAATADSGVGLFNISINLGKDWNAGHFRFGPVAGVQYTYAGTSPFTEQGADSLDLGVDSFGANSLRSSLGLRAAYTWQISERLTLVPEIRALWVHEFLAQPLSISSALDGGRASSFNYETGDTNTDSLFGGAGIGLRLGDRLTASLFYNINFSGSEYINNIIGADLNVAF